MDERTDNVADELWNVAVEQLPDLSVAEQRAGLALYAELSRGEPVTAARLAHALKIPVEEAERHLHDAGLGSLVHADDDGSAVGFFGLSTIPTDHRFTVDGRSLWTWCAIDTLFLPELLGLTATIESTDPLSNEAIKLTVSPAAVESAQPDGLLVSVNSPEAWETTSAVRLMTTACHYIHFFASSQSGEDWLKQHPETVLLPLADAFDHAKRQNQRMFGAALSNPEAGSPASG